MPTDNPAKPKRPLSKFALKYGPYPKNGQKPDFYKLLKGYRSGFTPVSPNKTADRERRKRWKNAVRLQQLILTNKIPLSEIRAIGAYAPTAEEDLGVNWEPTKLKNPIHPLFAKHNWERMPDYIKHYPPILIGDGHSGHYLADNPIIWKVLEPILQLASQYLENAHLWPWWDALLTSESSGNKQTEPNPEDAEMPNLRFTLRRPEEAAEYSAEVKQLLRDMAGSWVFKLRNSNHLPSYGSNYNASWWGVTTEIPCEPKGIVQLCCQYLKPLLRNDITEAEKMVINYSAANTMVHEVAHAAYKMYGEFIDPRIYDQLLGPEDSYPEPYFEDESLNELGHSMVQNVFKSGFYLLTAAENKTSQPLALFSQPWPFAGGDPGNSKFAPPHKQWAVMVGYFSPVSIEWMRLLQDSNFWDFYVAENGGEAFVSNTIISAKHVWDGEKAHGKKFHLHTPDYNTSIMPPNNKLITPGMNYAERLATVVANARISMHNDALERLDLIRRRDNGENTERVGEGESLDDQESVSSYDAPSDGEEEERPNEEQILQTERIAMLIRRFRNMLGLHKCVKCMQEGLLFYLDQLALLHHQGNVTPENWVLFLKQCNSSGQMLVWNPRTSVIRARGDGWDSPDPDSQPLPPIPTPKPTLTEGLLNDHISSMKVYFKNTIEWFTSSIPVRWHDLEWVRTGYLIGQTGSKLTITLDEFKSILIHHFGNMWTTGPPGTIQWIGPTIPNGISLCMKLCFKKLSTGVDIGATYVAETLITKVHGFIMNGDYPSLKAVPSPPPKLFVDIMHNFMWDMWAPVEPDVDGKIRFRYIYRDTDPSLLATMRSRITESQLKALQEWLGAYRKSVDDGGFNRNIWPELLRKRYNEDQEDIDIDLRIKDPRCFLAIIEFKFSEICSIAPNLEIVFHPGLKPSEEINEGSNQGQTQGQTPGGNQGQTHGQTPGGNQGQGQTQGQTPGGNQGQTQGQTPGQTPGGNQGQTQGGNQGQTQGQTPGQTPGGNQGQTQGGNQGQTQGQTPGQTPGGNQGQTQGGN